MKRKNPKRPYKSRPPFVSLKYALDVIGQVYLKYAGSASRDSFSNIINNVLSSSSFQNKLNACKNYGLLKVEGNKISLTDLANKIVVPHNEEERAIARKEAFLKINVFQEVYDKFCGKMLDPNYLPNYFEREVKVVSELKDKWSNSFIECGQAAGLLRARDNGKYVVLEGGEISPSKEAEMTGEIEDNIETPEIIDTKPVQKESLIIPTFEEAGYNRSRVSLSDGKYAEFLIPECSKKKDAKKLKAHLESLRIAIEGNVDEDIGE